MDFKPVIKEDVLSSVPVSGGDIGRSYRVTTQGRVYFIKYYSTPGVAQKEASGLREISAAGAVRVPELIGFDEHLLALGFIESSRRCPDFQTLLGKRLARMHRKTSDRFGFYEDNFCGSTPQPNGWMDDWAEFYTVNRLGHQVRLAGDPALNSAWEKLSPRIPDLLAGTEEPPSLIHGDLWGGNVISGEDGEPVLIDPAAYYAHREMELGMTRLFGGFSSEFYRAYDAEFPLLSGWEKRSDLYVLYHVLNHYNLFGGGYRSQALSIMRNFS